MEKHSFPLQEEATEQTPHVDTASLSNLSLCMQSWLLFYSSVTQLEQTISSERAGI